jgi:hypothetical protein
VTFAGLYFFLSVPLFNDMKGKKWFMNAFNK